jgi:hypothetical protein
MKKKIFLSLIITLIIGSCCREKESPIEGAWNLVYGSWTSMPDKTYPAQIGGGQVKMYTEKHFSHIGQFKLDTIVDNHGCGSYTLDGNKFEEKIIYRHGGTDQGKMKKLLVDVLNDTLVLRWPVDDTWKLAEKFNTEKYVRLE